MLLRNQALLCPVQQHDGDLEDVSMRCLLLVSHWTGSASRQILDKYWFSLIIPCKHKYTHRHTHTHTGNLRQHPLPKQSTVSERPGWTKTPTAGLFRPGWTSSGFQRPEVAIMSSSGEKHVVVCQLIWKFAIVVGDHTCTLLRGWIAWPRRSAGGLLISVQNG